MLEEVRCEAVGIRVRRLSANDAPELVRLLTQLGYPPDRDEIRLRLGAWTGDDRAAAFVACLEHRLVGCAAVYVMPFFERAGSRARLVALVVDEPYRGRGIGALLVGHAREFAVRHGAVEMELTSRRERKEAHCLYRRLGFEDQAVRALPVEARRASCKTSRRSAGRGRLRRDSETRHGRARRG